MLQFLGSGSAFNIELGNTSAFYKQDNKLLLIDCGENIFERILKSNILEGVDDIHILITHTHSDHVGSLASFILYAYYSHGESMKNKVIVYYPNEEVMHNLLKINGCVLTTHYNLKHSKTYQSTEIFNDIGIVPFVTPHVDEFISYGFEIRIGDSLIYYSGDTKDIYPLDLNGLKNAYTHFYIDTCGLDYEGNVHLSLSKLENLIAPEYRHKVYCMHLDKAFDKNKAKELGFNVVENYGGL